MCPHGRKTIHTSLSVHSLHIIWSFNCLFSAARDFASGIKEIHIGEGLDGGSSFVDHLCLVYVILSRLFIVALWPPAGKGLTSWLSFVVSNCEFVTFPLVSCVKCGT